MTLTTKDFKRIGFRILPIGKEHYSLVRKENYKKHIVNKEGMIVNFASAIPSNWTQTYADKATDYKNLPLGGVICGPLSNLEADEIEIIALDCDNQASWDLFNNLNLDYNFKSKSKDKPGGTIFYLLPEALKHLKQYSVKTPIVNFEYMSKRAGGTNAMVFLPTTANKTKEVPYDLEISLPPKQVIDLIFILQPKLTIKDEPAVISKRVLPYNAPLVRQFVDDSRKAATGQQQFGKLEMTSKLKKVYKIFTPTSFRSAKDYVDNGWLHPNSNQILQFGAWSNYIVSLSAIAGSDPSINVTLYTEFIQAINNQLDEPMGAVRLLGEVIKPMVDKKSKIKGQVIWKYNKLWDSESYSIVNQYGETLEYYILEDMANKFIEYNHTIKHVIEIQGSRAMREQIYSKDTDVEQAMPLANIVKKLKLISIRDSIKLPLGISIDSEGHTLLNTKAPCLPLTILQNPKLYTYEINENNLYVKAYNLFLNHLVNDDSSALLFIKQVIATHGNQLISIAVIIYIVGVGGAGKSIFARQLELLFGSNTTTRPTAKQITGRFNDFLVDTALLVLSETSDSSFREQEGIKAILKTVTGENAIDIEIKNQPIKQNIPIFCLPVLLANEPWYREDDKDRRLFSIMPRTPLLENKNIADFELEHGIRIVQYIEEGIREGIISKYLSKFAVNTLGPVPITRDKLLLSKEQQDPISVVKNLCANEQWFDLFDKFEEYEIGSFFTFMELKNPVDKDSLYKGHILELCKAMRGDLVSLSDTVISKGFTALWQPNRVYNFRSSPNIPKHISKSLGYIKWSFNLEKRYDEWKLENLQ